MADKNFQIKGNSLFHLQKGQWNDWVWENSGISVTFTNWLPNQPDNASGTDYCSEIFVPHLSNPRIHR